MAKKLKFGSKAYRLKYLGQGKATKKRKSKKSYSRGVYKTMTKKHKSKKSSKFSLKGALKIIIGVGIAAVYEVFVSPMIPLSRNVKNMLEMGIGLLLLVLPKMPMPVRAFGGALATINLFEMVVPLLSKTNKAVSSASLPDYN